MNLVSIILPTYNRQSFLPEAFRSIGEQTHQNWELIIVDDGGTDNSLAVIEELKATVSHSVKVISQQNGGPAAARNRGIQEAKGDFIAFFDSDDYWLPEHLSLALQTFAEFTQLEWIYFACKRVNKLTSETLLPSTFYTDNRQNKLFEVSHSLSDTVFQLDNVKAALTQITHGVDSGFQNSVFKRHVFEQLSIPNFRIGEDRLFILKALKQNIQTAFIDHVSVIYYVHDDNTSDTDANSKDYEKRIASMQRLIESYQATLTEVELTRKESRELKKRLSEDYFWKLGYSLQLAAGQQRSAVNSMWKGIKHYPFKFKYWKTFLVTALKMNK